MFKYLLFTALLYFISYLYYVKVSHGLGHKAEFLQLRRFLPCAILAILPAAITQIQLTNNLLLMSMSVGISWIVTYPLLYWATYHKNSTDFGFHFDTVFGLYIIGWLTALKLLIIYFNIFPIAFLTLITTVEFLILLIPVSQWIFYFLYKSCIDENSMMMLQETHYNEIIEFFKSFSVPTNLFIFVIPTSLYGIFVYLNITALANTTISLNVYQLITLLAVITFLTIYLWKKGKGVFVRTGIIELYLDVKEYFETTKLYTQNMNDRLKDLQVIPEKPVFDKPSTILLIIGESESRDYMSAFVDCEYNTTPWLKAQKNNKNFLFFSNSYSCIAHTVSCLERALTEFNQYSDKQFYTSCSIIDIAHKAGYTTHWYSNQGHLGCADTPVTLVANTSQTAKWTKQNLNQVQYDEALLEYLDEVDPQKNNFVILHLKGNHFNFINRYPAAFTKWGTPGKYDLILNYLNSIAYTDSILEKIYEYTSTKLNLQAMLYFSDHGTLPDKRRSPNFDGFGTVRIPMFAWFSDEYIEKNTSVYQTLANHQNYYFTNDLAYELMCSIFNIKSNHFDETNSLASPQYKFTRDMLTTDLGKMYIKDDTTK
ncbi:phosphoethanolamine transferase [uncultured Phascolarctobacterium sp.]|uniref:phosphoethanolamine transferase n=1 Tax=uncultured Phascolarctobacterium sp. TaxID=512296 RepID=UPI00260A709E|nr:phosphoethanolamine transferase [uncultured Phascolarctobacterium sp.]